MSAHLMSQVFVGESGCLSACGWPSVVHEPIDSRQHLAAVSFLTNLGQPTVSEGNVMQTQSEGISLPNLDRVSGSCISLLDLYVIVALYCCRWRSIY